MSVPIPYGREYTDVSGEPLPNLLAGLRTGGWLDRQDFPPVRWAVPGLLPEGSTLLVGPPKIGKSWFVLDAALAVASGGLALGGLHCPERDVLLLALEDGDRRLQDRCRMLLGTVTPIPEQLSYMTRITPGRVVDTVEAWLSTVDNPGLVIVDTLGRVMPPAMPGESSYQRDYRIGAQLKKLSDDNPGLCLLVNHHDRKAGADDFVDSVSGTHGLAGAADTICVLARQRQETTGTLKITGRDVPECEYALGMVDGVAWQLHGGDLAKAAEQARIAEAQHNLGDDSARIVALVMSRPDGVRAACVADAFGMDARKAKDYLGRLARNGRIAKGERGLYLPPTVSPPSPLSPLGEGRGDTCDGGDTPTGGT